eukprot:GCRY01000310.1.p1 GENE.GCRY01000310.1~~GCRY01000310.1.p1  ORF type:complete len:154 (+),score=21.22 GCRY01000310.1:86-547(+)
MDNLLLSVSSLPWDFLVVPNLKLKFPRIPKPSSQFIFYCIVATYFLVLSGIIYDIIVEPPSIGSVRDEVTGAVKPIVFLQYRINGQFIVEGLSAGMLFCFGGLGIILLDKSTKPQLDSLNRYLLLAGGILCWVISYNLAILFLRMKLPGYQLT